MNLLTLLTIVSGICTIISFFADIFFKSKRWLWLTTIFIITFLSGIIVYYQSELVRINNIHKQATSLKLEPYGDNLLYIQSCLVFLEENRDRYPDSYERAKEIYKGLKESESSYTYGSAKEIQGIVEGIANLNKNERE